MTHYQVILGRVPNQSSDFQTNPKSYLDTFGEESISLNYNIADIVDLSNKNSSYSKTIRFPNTRNNQQVFSDIWSLNMTTEYTIFTNNSYFFDPNIKTRAWILKDNVIQFEGNLQLTNIVYDYIQDSIVYECVVYSDNDGLYKSIGEGYLSDLDLSRFDHKWNSTNILYSWNAPYGNGWYYPLIDYGTPLSTDRTFRVSDFRPGIYFKTIWDQIFSEAGYTYDSDFLNTDFFKHLIMPYSNKSLPGSIDLLLSPQKEVLKIRQNTTQIYSYTASTPSTTTGIYYVQGQYFYHGGYMVGDTNVFNPNDLYNFTQSWYKNPSDQRFAQKVSIDINTLRSKLTYSGGNDQWGNGDIYIFAFRSGTSTDFGPTGSVFNVFGISAPQPPYNRAWKPLTFAGKRYYSLKENPQGLQVGYDSITQEYQFRGTIVTDTLIDPNSLQEDEKIMIWFGRDSVLTYRQAPLLNLVSSTLKMEQMTLSVIYDDTQAVENSLILINKILPNMKQKDFITNVIRMFNLYIDVDKTQTRRFLIEPRDEYYSKYQRTQDWSEKLDLSKQISSQIASNLQNRTQTLTYKEDKDYYNTEYKNITNTIFGEYKYDFDNEFASGEKKIELIFSPTPVDRLRNSNQMYLPSIFGFNNGNLTNLGGFNPRVLYVQTLGLTAGDSYRFWTNGFNNGVPATMSVYPYASFSDDPLNPTYSLNFGTIQPFISGYNETINNLYYTYYQNTFLELNNAQSRIVEGYFNLTPTDISDFSFADLFYVTIDNVADYYRVNKIMDYDPSKYQSTKVQLIKALNYTNNLFDSGVDCNVVITKSLTGTELTDYLNTINSYYYDPIYHYMTITTESIDAVGGDFYTLDLQIITYPIPATSIVDWANDCCPALIPGMVATYIPGLTQCTLNFEVEMGEEATNVFVGSLNVLWDNSPANGGSGPDPYVVIYINYPCGATYGTWEENNNTYFWTLTGDYDQYTFLDWWLTNIPGSYGTASGEILAEGAYLKIGWDWETACTQSAACSGEGLQLYIAQSNVDYLPGGWTPDLFVEEPILGPTSGIVYDQGGLTYGPPQDICECQDETLSFAWTKAIPCPGGELTMFNYISTPVGEEIQEMLFTATDDCFCERPELSRSGYLNQSTGFRTPPPLSNTAYLGVLNTSSDNLVTANNNIVLGSNTNVFSSNNIVVGNDNGNIVGGFNFILGASNSTTDTSNRPSVLIGTNIDNQVEGTFIFGNNVQITQPFGTTSSTASIATAQDLFVIGSNLSLGGSQSLPPNTTYLGTENIIISEGGGFNTPFIISEAASTPGFPTGQSIIKTYTGFYILAPNTAEYLLIYSDVFRAVAEQDYFDMPLWGIVYMEINIRIVDNTQTEWTNYILRQAFYKASVGIIETVLLFTGTTADTKQTFSTTLTPSYNAQLVNTDINSPGVFQPNLFLDNSSLTDTMTAYWDITLKYQYT